MKTRIDFPSIPLPEQTPAVSLLLRVLEKQQIIIHQQTEEIQILKEEIKRLKGHKGKPKIKPSQMDKGKSNKDPSNSNKRNGSEKRNKNVALVIHEEKTIQPENIPEGSRFKGYQYYVVQDLVIETRNTRYRLERWEFPDGSYHIAPLPAEIKGYHFGPVLRSFVDYQYHHQQITQPLLLEQLRAYGIDISAGELNRLITEDKAEFHQEKTEILPAGFKASTYIHVDDTGARHQGKNGYCTHIGNELFAWFASTGSKSRINFLELLQMGQKDYVINADALAYMKKHKLPSIPLSLLQQAKEQEFLTKESWEKHLDFLEIKNKRHRQIATEGGLTGSILAKGFFVNVTIMSDDAGQFNIFQHILCWIHAERKINELVPLNDGHAKDIKHIRSLFWEIYDLLKGYKLAPNDTLKVEIEKKFDEMCKTKTCYELLNNVLKRLHNNKDELLLVLKHPEFPLHNNLSERDIREYVKKRKISGGTRSDNGKKSRDTFASLKKTCKKLKINFWDYLLDRHRKLFNIPWIPKLITQAAAAT
jgi:Transposase IS66 family